MELIEYLIKLNLFYVLVFVLGTLLINGITLEIKNEYSKLFYKLFSGLFFLPV